MEHASSNLSSLPCVYKSEFRSESLPTAPLLWSSQTSLGIMLTVHKPVKTPGYRKMNSLTVLSIPRDSTVAGWHLKSLLVVQISHKRKELVATTWLEGVAEYGTAKNENEAIADLIVSLGEYLEVLEGRENNLGDSARNELDCLRRLIEPLHT